MGIKCRRAAKLDLPFLGIYREGGPTVMEKIAMVTSKVWVRTCFRYLTVGQRRGSAVRHMLA